MDATFPEIGTVEVFLTIISEEILDVLAYERRGEIACSLIAVDHRRRGRQQTPDPVLRGDEGFADLLARRDIVPGADHLDWITLRVAQQLQLVADPAIAAILLAEAVFDVQAV